MSSEKFNDDFQSRSLYKNSCETPDGLFVDTNMYAIRWTYPGAITATTGRLRITTVYSLEEGFVRPEAGLIERWSDKGWLLLEEYVDSYAVFTSPEQYQELLVHHAHAFIMGVPLKVVDPDWDDDYPGDTVGTPHPKSNIKIVYDADKSKKTPEEDDSGFSFLKNKDKKATKKKNDEPKIKAVKKDDLPANNYDNTVKPDDDSDDDGDDLDWI